MLGSEDAALTLDESAARPRVRNTAPLIEWLAVGGAALLLLPVAWLLRASLGLDAAEYAVGFAAFHAAFFVNDPHFAVTYLLFYGGARERVRDPQLGAAQRARYVLAGAVVPVLLAAWAVLALATRNAQALGWMIQLMFLLVGWHYAKQGFGVLMVLSSRRGVRFSAWERHVILAYSYAAWAFAWANPAHAAGEFEEKGVVYWAPAVAHGFELAAGSVLALATVALAVVLSRKLRRERQLPWAPLSAFLITIWLLTIYTTLDPLLRYVIPALHSIQYLYFVRLMKRNQALAHEGPPSFGPPAATRVTMLALSALALGWVLFHGAPWLLDATFASAFRAQHATLGFTPCFAALYALVNIHHYFMDAAIWRREHAETRYLTESDGAAVSR